MAPKGWEYHRFDELAEFKNGLNFPAEARGSGLKLVGVGDFQDRLRVEIDGLEELSGFDGVDSDYLLQNGDLVFVRSNGNKALIGRVLMLDNIDRPVSHSGFTIRARIKGNAWVRMYIAHFFHADMARGQFHRLGGGTNISNLSQDILGAIEIPVPPRTLLEPLVRVLEASEDLVTQTSRRLAMQKQIKRALLQLLLTGRRRFKQFAGQTWRKCRIGDVLKEVQRYVDWSDDDLYHLVSIRRRSGGLFERESKPGRDILTKVMKTTRTGDFVIARMQVVHGAMGMTKPEFDGKHVSDSYLTFVVKDPHILYMPFFDYLSQTREMYHKALRSSYGVAIEKMTFNLPWFLQETIRVPPTIEEQRRIVDVLETCDRELAALSRQLELLKDQKRGFMQNLVTGKIRLKGVPR